MSTIAFTTELAGGEENALATAVALAAASGSRLVSVHATSGDEPVRGLDRAQTLAARWGVSIEHEAMVHSCCDDVTDTLLDALRRLEPSLVVAATHGRGAFAQLVTGSVAESVARNVSVPALLVPFAARGLADVQTGALDVKKLLIAGGDAEATRVGLDAAARLARFCGASRIDAVLVHVSENGSPAPEPTSIPEGLHLERRQSAEGPLETAIASLADEIGASAIVMATRGHDGLVDTFAGSHTERVLRQCRCPLLSVPLVR